MRIVKNIGLVMLGFVLLGALAITTWSVNAYKQPLGPSLVSSLSPVTATTSLSSPTLDTSTTTPVQNASPTVAADTAVLPAGAEVCGETAAWNILVIGSDAGDLRYVKGSDFTRILRVDFPNKKVTMYAFPRDLWVNTWDLGLDNPSIDAAKLGSVFYEARYRSNNSGLRESMIDATGVTARMLYQNFNVKADHYFSIDLTQLPAVVNAVGGIPINIPTRTTDRYIGMVFQPGQQTLNGEQVVAYARAIPDSDFNRIRRNSILLEAFRQKLLDPSVWMNIPSLYLNYKDVFATDFSPEQINHLACLLKEVPNTSIVQAEVQPEWTTPGPVQKSLRWDKFKVLNQLMDLGIIQP